MSQQQLPAELLSYIVSFATTETLANVALCSREFYDFALPYLYETLDVRPRRAVGRRHHHDRFGLGRLLELFMKKPQIAVLVRKLSIWPAFTNNAGHGVYQCRCGKYAMISEQRDLPDHVEQLLAALEDYDRKFWELPSLEEAYIAYSEDAMLAFLLCTLPRLKSIDLATAMNMEWVPKVVALRCAYHTLVSTSQQELEDALPLRFRPVAGLPMFPELQDVRWSSTGPEHSNLLEEMLDISSAKRISCDNFRSANGVHNPWGHLPRDEKGLRKLKPASSNMEKLELRYCELNNSDMSGALRFPKALKSFVYEIHPEHIEQSRSDYQQLRQSLGQHEQSLEHLCLDADDNDWPYLPTFDTPWIDSLQSFQKLTHVRLSAGLIFNQLALKPTPGWESLEDFANAGSPETVFMELLPRHIETFELGVGDAFVDRTCASLEHLLSHRASVPALSSVSLDVRKSSAAIYRERLFRTLPQLGQDNGVRVSIRERYSEDIFVTEPYGASLPGPDTL
ncbi:uncharacterized protein LTR77_008936 [Saxophila tyrrhenica]|uniref:F-box domain-containing protein n=1 Tax=Saxophila tyrrhenica TaxID=1690608 RepID=A0AAV9P382_9PEZI|nr:hypothetical protein LTR77_008936 [Saxophila tyrrhenica]